MKLLVWLLLPALIAAAVIGAISWYLTPNDLQHCPKTPDASIAGCSRADAIVAISGGDTRARTSEAISLYERGWADMLIFSGAAYDKDSPSNARAMQAQAIEAGVPTNDIAIEEYARDTAENAKRTLSVANERGVQRIILVTSAYHQRRAGIEFRQTFEGVTVIDHPVLKDKDWSSTWWLTPRGWWLAGSELVKILVTQVRGNEASL